MANEDMTGALFKNDKPQSDKSPTHTGYVIIGGKRYRLSAWVREAKNSGKRFFSIRASEDQQKPQGGSGGGGDTF